MSYWRERAASAIEAAILRCVNVDLKNLSEQDKQQLRREIDASYPFGVRKNYPYQTWLDERRKAFYRLGLTNPPEDRGRKRKPPIGCDSTVPGQQSLF
ncbi:hypothetical protein [Nostoc sp.]|uniref:hypothetical protein n=1 Tax=Nostoc sp. TaxID=1180 RepID=UPI002FEEA6C4